MEASTEKPRKQSNAPQKLIVWLFVAWLIVSLVFFAVGPLAGTALYLVFGALAFAIWKSQRSWWGLTPSERQERRRTRRDRGRELARELQGHIVANGEQLRSARAPMSAVSLHYLGGHPSVPSARPVKLWREGGSLKMLGGGSWILIPLADIKGCTLEMATKRSLAGGIGWTLAGGMLLPVVGTALGAIHGFRAQDASVVRLALSRDGRQFDVFFGGKDVKARYPRLAALLR